MRLTEKQKETLKKNNLESNKVTREAIQGALYLLMERKAYNEITMTDIVKRSGVSRSALYRNYKAKEDIILDIVNDFMESFAIYQSDSLRRNWEFGFQYFIDNKKSLDLIVKAGLEHLLLDKLNERLRCEEDCPDLVEAMNYGLVFNVFMYWTKCGMPDMADEAAAKIVAAYQAIIRDVERQYEVN